MGLENAVTEEYGLANWGMKVVGLEGLAAVDGPDVHLFYIHAEGQDAFENEWKDNPVWTNLEIAKESNRHPRHVVCLRRACADGRNDRQGSRRANLSLPCNNRLPTHFFSCYQFLFQRMENTTMFKLLVQPNKADAVRTACK
jgi:hypothetical protein